MRQLTDDQIEDLKEVVTHHGFQHVMSMIDDIVENIRGNVLSVPLDKDPEKAKTQLLIERMKLEGAVAVRNVLSTKVIAIKERK